MGTGKHPGHGKIHPMKPRITLIACLMTAWLSGCGPKAETFQGNKEVRTFTNVTLDSGFDTVITLVEQTDDQEQFQAHFKAMCDSFTHYNQLFDIYHTYDGINNLKTVNDNAGIQPVKTDPELIELIDRAKYFSSHSDQSFDITMGSLLQLWHEYRTEGIAANENGSFGTVPDSRALKEAGEHRGYDHIVIDRSANTVFIDDPDISIDAGGIAKGFATEKTALLLESLGCTHAAVNAGGNNRTIGEKTDGTPWNVGIQNPDGEGSVLVLHMDGTGSFVTSGDYERFYIAGDGNRYHHIIDPATRMPSDRYRSVTVITPDSADADCLSTSLFNLSLEDGKKLLETYRRDSGKDAEAVWLIDASRKPETSAFSRELGSLFAVYTEGLEGRITWKLS